MATSGTASTAQQTIHQGIAERPAPVRNYGAGQHLFYEGDRARWVFEVKSGVLRQTRFAENGRREVTAFAFAGDIVGLPGPDGRHGTSCDVLSAASVVLIPAGTLAGGGGGVHDRLVIATLAELARMREHCAILGRRSATERLASFLLSVGARRAGEDCSRPVFDLPMCRADIADYLGLTTETVSRTFTRLRGLGLIALPDAQRVVVTDPQGLADLAAGG